MTAVTKIHIESWRAAFRGIVPDVVLDRKNEGETLSSWRSTIQRYPDNLFIANSPKGTSVGFCCAGPVVDTEKNLDFEYEIYGLHVDPIDYRKGIGTALLNNAFDRMTNLGLCNAIVWTLEKLGSSRSFYEKNGGIVVKSGIWKIGGAQISEVAYGWMGVASK